MSHKILFLDTETGGIHPESHDLLSVGLVVWEDKIITAKEEILVKGLSSRVTQEALAINKIELEEHNSVALTRNKAAQQIIAFIELHFSQLPVVLAGHNVGFDVGFIKRLFDKTGFDYERYFSHRLIDTTSILQYLAISRNVSPQNLRSFSSSDQAFKNFKVRIKKEDRHTALGDAVATAKLFTKLIEDNKELANVNLG